MEIVVLYRIRQIDLPFRKNNHSALGSCMCIYHCDIIPGVTSSNKWSNLGQLRKKSTIFFIVSNFLILIKFPTF